MLSDGEEYFPTSDSDFVIDQADEDAGDEVQQLPPVLEEVAAAPPRVERESKKRKSAERKEKRDHPLQWEIWEEENERWIDEYGEEKTDNVKRPLEGMADPPSDIITPSCI